MEQTDWHARNEERFAGDVAALLEKMHRKEMLESIVIAAPPGFMGAFRKALADPVKARIQAEFTKDLTGMPVDKIVHAIVES